MGKGHRAEGKGRRAKSEGPEGRGQRTEIFTTIQSTVPEGLGSPRETVFRLLYIFQAVTPLFHEPACEILMDNAAHQCLIRQSFLHGSKS
jgi:hypothetical protein